MLDATATVRITRSVGAPPTFVGSDLWDHACGPAFMQVPDARISEKVIRVSHIHRLNVVVAVHSMMRLSSHRRLNRGEGSKQHNPHSKGNQIQGHTHWFYAGQRVKC